MKKERFFFLFPFFLYLRVTSYNENTTRPSIREKLISLGGDCSKFRERSFSGSPRPSRNPIIRSFQLLFEDESPQRRNFSAAWLERFYDLLFFLEGCSTTRKKGVLFFFLPVKHLSVSEAFFSFSIFLYALGVTITRYSNRISTESNYPTIVIQGFKVPW